MMKRILITGAGGAPATNFVRSLRAAPEQFHLIGTDCNEFYLQRAETDEKYLVPRADEGDYIDILNEIIDETNAQFLHVQNDAEMYTLSKNRERLNITTFLPEHKTIEICQNKFESFKVWSKAGLRQPQTLSISTEADLKEAFRVLGKNIWLREVSGAGGRGAIVANSYEFAKSWIDFRRGWGSFTAAECLQDHSVTWMSIWKGGQLVVAQGRKRLYWELSKIAPSGVSGATGGGVTVNDPSVDQIAQEAIFAIDGKPNGIFSVDLTYDHKNIPNPTEINIGRFFTTHEFFTRAGLNMPYIFVKLAYGEQLPVISKRLNPLPSDLVWIRGIDFLPVLTTMSEIDRYKEELMKRRGKHGKL
jgi:carbamoyl-phosphate synthase large subunit